MKVLSVPHLTQLGSGESGINTVVKAYFKHGPEYGIQFVKPDAKHYDLVAVHAGILDNMPTNFPLVAHTHGLYWSADYHMPSWAHRANARVVRSVRLADVVTVPSEWVADTFRRDMHLNPEVLPHGIDWDMWQHDEPNEGYVIGYAKNRSGMDVCDPSFLNKFVTRFPQTKFLSTFSDSKAPNMKVTGLLPHEEMRATVQRAAVYMNTVKETWGVGMLEALASGVPVLGFNHGGAKELVVHGVTGYLAQPGNYDDLAQGLDYCLTYRDQLGDNARHHARQFTWEKAIEQLAGIYQTALSPKPPTVGIVIPVYNKPVEQVKRAIESAIGQTKECIVVVVDDGSDDQSYLGNIADDYPSVRTIKQSNQGVAYARNAGIESLDSVKYVCCLDSDDWIDPTFIETCVKELEQDKSLGMAYTGLTYHKPDGETGLSPWPDGFDYEDQIKYKNQVPTCCVYRRDAWQRLGGYRQRYAMQLGAGSEDAEFFTRIGAIGYDGKQVTKDGLFHYSWMSGLVSGNKDYQQADFLAWHPWVKDGQHPFASVAKPRNNWSHPVRQYDEPSVSVIIPVGPGHEHLLFNALDSLEAQTFRYWEAIVVWDSPELLGDDSNGLKAAYPYVRWYRTGYSAAGLGAGYSRNRGVEKARGDYLLFLDADDWLHPDCIDSMVNKWGVEGKAVYTDYMGISTVKDPRQLASDLQNNIVSYNERTHEAVIRYESGEFSSRKALRQPEDPPYIWNNVTTLIPKTWHEEIGGFDESMVSWEDVDYWYRMAWSGKEFVRISEPLMAYRFSTGSRRETGLKNWPQLLAYLKQKRKNHV